MHASIHPLGKANHDQVAYLMADISNVNASVIKDLYERLESLPCKKNLRYPLPYKKKRIIC